MILLDISLFFLDSLNPVSVSEAIAAVFLAERAAASGGWGAAPGPGGGWHQLQSGGVQLQKLLQEEESCSCLGMSEAMEAPAGGEPWGRAGSSWAGRPT